MTEIYLSIRPTDKQIKIAAKALCRYEFDCQNDFERSVNEVTTSWLRKDKGAVKYSWELRIREVTKVLEAVLNMKQESINATIKKCKT